MDHLEGFALIPVTSFFPGRSSRWVAENCRSGRVPRAVRVGRTWMIRPLDFAAFVSGGSASREVPSVDDALADLRARGVCP